MGVIKNLYTNKPLLLTILALTALGLLFNPLLALPKMIAFVMLTFTALVVGARLAKSGVKSAWSSLGASVSKQEETNTKQGKVDQAVNSMGNGKDLADPMIKALVDKLRDNGLTVTTNWDVAKQVIDALPEKYRHLSENRDNVRGFVYKGKVFINPEKVDLSVPIHEYTHIWAEALRQNNMNEWQNIVSMLKKETQLWEDTKKNYPYLETDDEIADEVLAQYSGTYGADKLKGYIVEGDKPKTVFKNLFKALEEFWKHIAKMFDCHFKKTDEIADRVLYDLVRGYNPQKNIDPHVATLSDNKPLSSKKESNEPEQQEDAGVVTAMVDINNERKDVVPTPSVAFKPGDRVRQQYFDPLPEWVHANNLHIFKLTRNGEHVGYGVSYNVFGCKDMRIIDDATGRQYFDAADVNNYYVMRNTSYQIMNQYFLGTHVDYSQQLRIVAGMIERNAEDNMMQFYYDDYSKIDILRTLADHYGIDRGQVYCDLRNEMIDLDHRGGKLYYRFKELLYDVNRYLSDKKLVWNTSFRTDFLIPAEVMQAYTRTVNTPIELSKGEIFTKEEKEAFKDYASTYKGYDINYLFDAVKEIYWYRRENISITQDQLDYAEGMMYLAAGLENPGVKVLVDKDAIKTYVADGFLYRVGLSDNGQPIYAVENKLDNGKYECKVLSTKDLHNLQGGIVNMQHIRNKYWPEQRLNKVVDVVLERAKDSSARSFTDDQKAVIRDYFSKYPTKNGREHAYYEVAYKIKTHQDAKNILGEWLDDAMKEFRDMASGQERESHRDKNLSY